MNVIEFDGLMEHAAARWPRIRDGVYARLETLLAAKLGPNDLFVRLGETAYLVTMPTSGAQEVSAVCTRVAFDLHTSFLGECSLAQLHVSLVSECDQDTLAFNRLGVDQIIRIAKDVGILDQLRFRPSEAEMDTGAAGASRAKQSVGGVASAPVVSAAGAAAESSPDIEYHYIPIWAVPSSAITTYACEPKSIYLTSRTQPVALSYLSPRDRMQVELSCLQVGLAQLTKSISNGARFLLAAPISFEMLGAPVGRAAVLSLCKELPNDIRQYLSFLIYEVPPGVAQTRLANMVNALRSVSRGVSATIAPTLRAYTAYQGIGLRAIGFDMREFTNLCPFQQNDAEQLAQFARRSNLGTLIANVKEKSTLKYAQDAGIQLLSGAAIAPYCVEPRGMCRLTWAETLSKPDTELWV
ncbi:hypothetical protein FHS83_002254 [Rhizomicrobium palustre]|uniref:EAL domain-containing protein n=1 Tax=Rhizomicrobium palustre TaxID=189966 RepID=A0A846MZT1_9PROT|nr:hypothetical protein [Rhizomicrobium palustre]NIK88936.1 hypothetical protein [Rhizomicrobium palustre]